MVFVDSGDLFFDPAASASKQQAQGKAKLISRAYKRMQPLALNIGDRDLFQGIDFLRKEISAGLPFISANLLDAATGGLVFPPYKIEKIAGWRIGFLGLMPEPPPHIKNATGGSLLIRNPTEAAREWVHHLRGQVDFLVLLSDLGHNYDQQIARAVPGIHFILGGHDGRYMKYAQKEGGAFILQSYTKGMYIGELRLTAENTQAPFHDQRAADRIRESMHDLDRRLSNSQRTQARQASPGLDSMIQEIQRQKTSLQEELKRELASPAQGNLFSWNLEPVEKVYPEDDKVLKWIEDAGIDKD